jgi:hypothetical protein
MDNSQKVVLTPPCESLMWVLEHSIAAVVEELAGNVQLRGASSASRKVEL